LSHHTWPEEGTSQLGFQTTLRERLAEGGIEGDRERELHMSDSQGQILALAARQKSSNRYQLFRTRLDATRLDAAKSARGGAYMKRESN
jgi:hypothetical protein